MSLTRDREQEIISIESQMLDVQRIYRDLALQVNEQSEMLDRIECNVVSASMEIPEGRMEIRSGIKKSSGIGNFFGGIVDGISNLFAPKQASTNLPNIGFNPERLESKRSNNSESISNSNVRQRHSLTSEINDCLDDDLSSSDEDMKVNQVLSDIQINMDIDGRDERKSVVNIQPHMRQIDAFVIFAKADGSFNFTSEFEKIINVSRQDIQSSIPKLISDLNLSQTEKFNLWVTIIAIAFLEKNFIHEEMEWALIADKAKKYVVKKSDFSPNDVDNFVSDAKILL